MIPLTFFRQIRALTGEKWSPFPFALNFFKLKSVEDYCSIKLGHRIYEFVAHPYAVPSSTIRISMYTSFISRIID